jgi:CubicO group peptidase (beta-lactamase class C family)
MMKLKPAKGIVIALLSLALFGQILTGCSDDPQSQSEGARGVASAKTGHQDLDAYMTKKMKKAGLIGMQVAYVSGSDMIWQGSYGTKEFNGKEPVDDHTLFMIASCSKPITALGILKLKDLGKLSLDDPINQYLPFQVIHPGTPGDEITIRMLLSHVSYIRDNWEVLMPLYTLEQGGDSPIPLGEFLRAYLVEGGKFYHPSENFSIEPNTAEFAYCNVGYALLGYLIEEVSGMSFRQFMEKEIFIPLGMTQSFWFLADIPHDNIARPHEMPHKRSDITVPRMLPHFGYPDFPDGQLRTTASDYGRFLQLLLNRGRANGSQFIHPATVEDFLRIQYPETNKYQAIAWNYNEFDSFLYYLLMPRLPSHTGADPGVATAVSFDTASGTGAVIFTNSPPTRFGDQKIFYQEIMKRLLEEAKQQIREP